MDKLAEIVAHKRREIEGRLRPVRGRELAHLAGLSAGSPGFAEALARPDRLSVIAEIKRRSPSAGSIREDIEAVEQARSYLNAGVDAMSVLTDEAYFGGSLRDLWEVTDFVREHRRQAPCLRKDFMLHPVQVVEAAEAGAAAILIIVRAVSDDEAKALRDAAGEAGLDCLWEAHTEREAERALGLGARILGVNNRDLSTFVIDLSFCEKILPQLPEDITSVAESGIFEPGDARRMAEAGADAILVGQALMESEEPEVLVQAFQGMR